MTQARGIAAVIGTVLQRRERGRLEDAAFLMLVRAQLAAFLEIRLERRVGHQRVPLLLAVGLARILPDVDHLVERPDLGRGVKHRLPAVLHLGRVPVLLIQLQPGGELVVMQRVDAQVKNHAGSPMKCVANRNTRLLRKACGTPIRHALLTAAGANATPSSTMRRLSSPAHAEATSRKGVATPVRRPMSITELISASSSSSRPKRTSCSVEDSIPTRLRTSSIIWSASMSGLIPT